MSSPDPSDKLDPTIDPSLLELDGTTYKDLSHSAAAKRAAYHFALARKRADLLASSSNVTTHEQTVSTFSPNGLIYRLDDFRNFGTAPSYTLQGGTQEAGSEGWIMHSRGAGDSSRLRFDFVFNDGSAPFTLIGVMMRAAPDNGKNSYACLREARCAESNQSGCDEVDIVEYYGYPPNPRAEWTIYQSGNTSGNVGHGPYSQLSGNSDPGHTHYTYQVYLERGNYINFDVYGPGGTRGFWERHVSEGYVPTQPMYFYAGIWDCSSSDSNHTWCDDGSGPVNGDTWMAISSLFYNTGGRAR